MNIVYNTGDSNQKILTNRQKNDGQFWTIFFIRCIGRTVKNMEVVVPSQAALKYKISHKTKTVKPIQLKFEIDTSLSL